MGSSQTRDRTPIFCIGRWILYHWATREAQFPLLYFKFTSKEWAQETLGIFPLTLIDAEPWFSVSNSPYPPPLCGTRHALYPPRPVSNKLVFFPEFSDVAEVHLAILIRAARAQSSHSSQKRKLFVGACLDSIPIGGWDWHKTSLQLGWRVI